jgi:hypothetical protein
MEGPVADKSLPIILDGLTRAVTEPAGLPLFAYRKSPGLFQSTAPARLAASRCKDEGYLHVIHSESHGKRLHEVCAITEKGLAYLLDQVSPKRILEQLVEMLGDRGNQTAQLIATVGHWQTELEKIRALVAKVLEQLQSPSPVRIPPGLCNGSGHSVNMPDAWLSEAVAYLHQRNDSTIAGDCPLPDLYRQVLCSSPKLTIGLFHDGLRKLHEQEKIYLHPWTGPLYEIPEPPYSMMIGHEIAYYASAQKDRNLDLRT